MCWLPRSTPPSAAGGISLNSKRLDEDIKILSYVELKIQDPGTTAEVAIVLGSTVETRKNDCSCRAATAVADNKRGSEQAKFRGGPGSK